MAIRRRYIDRALLLIDNFDGELINEDNESTLHTAIKAGWGHRIRDLIDKQFKYIQHLDENGDFSLILAIKYDHATAAELIIRAGAEIMELHPSGVFPISFVDSLTMFESLTNTKSTTHSFDPYKQDAPGNSTILLRKSNAKHLINALDMEGLTALARATTEKKSLSLRILLKAGADPTINDLQEETALHKLDNSVDRVHSPLISIYRGDVHAKNLSGDPPVWIAAQYTNSARSLSTNYLNDRCT